MIDNDITLDDQSKVVLKIETLLGYLTSFYNTPSALESLNDDNVSTSSSTLNNNDFLMVNNEQTVANRNSADLQNQKSASSSASSSTKIIQSQFQHTYLEMLAMYEREKTLRIETETNYLQKAKESNKLIENLNREMSNLSTIIEELRKQYTQMQSQNQFQMEQLIRINEEIRNESERTDTVCEQFRQENLKLKAENKQLYGEKTILYKELDEQFQQPQSLEDALRIISNYRNEVVKLVIANQTLNRQHLASLDSIKQLQNKYFVLRKQYQENIGSAGASGATASAVDEEAMNDQFVIKQSLESELERERKVRQEVETNERDLKIQLKTVKEKGQSIIDSLKQRIEQYEFEIKKAKEDNSELANQIQSLKKDAKNSLSVQEDLVRLIQSLQIELNQVKQDQTSTLSTGSNNDSISSQGGSSGAATSSSSMNDSSARSRLVQVRCQHEDDFSDCAACKVQFSVTKRKHRCKHCCKVYCADCCNKVIFSGPNLRAHKVCVSCHTLLDKDTQPIVSS